MVFSIQDFGLKCVLIFLIFIVAGCLAPLILQDFMILFYNIVFGKKYRTLSVCNCARPFVVQIFNTGTCYQNKMHVHMIVLLRL